MKRHVTLILLILLTHVSLSAQEWIVPVDGERYFGFADVVTIDDGESVLGIGCIRTEDGYIAKITKGGEYVFREVHLPGMMLEYFTAVQLNNGNYMAFGVCDDSLCDYHKQKYLRVDVFDHQLDWVSSRMYCVDDDVFDYFIEPWDGYIMQSILSKSGTVILAARLSYLEETPYGYHNVFAMRFYEFDNLGDTIRIVDNPLEHAIVGAIKEITYEPHSDNLMIVVDGGEFGYDSGSPGIYVADANLNIIAHQSMLRLGGADVITDNACEGKWFDGDRILVDCEQYIGSHFTFQTLYVVDSALNVYADLRLPPYDSCAWAPYGGTTTTFINDSTIFAFSESSAGFGSWNIRQVNVMLVDKYLNLLGRKILRSENVMYFTSTPTAFNDGGCMVLISSRNGSNYPGTPFNKYELMKFRREDIEITWDVVQENSSWSIGSVYPNPSNGIINIAVDEPFTHETRIRIYDIRGEKCLDSAVGKAGNLITLDINTLDNGLYIYQLVSGNRELASGKFVKE